VKRALFVHSTTPHSAFSCLGCFNLFCNVWVSVCVGYFDNCVGSAICVLEFTVFCIVRTVFLYCFFYVYLFLFVLSVVV
jgi:hypothetical protein